MSEECANGKSHKDEQHLKDLSNLVAAIAEDMPQITRLTADTWRSLIYVYEELAERHAASRSKFLGEIDKLDTKIGVTLSNWSHLFTSRARSTQNCELVLTALMLWEMLSELVPDLLRCVAKKEEEESLWDSPTDYGNVFADFARSMCALTAELERLSVTHTAWLKPAAEEYPFWPMRRFLHEDANNHFPRLAEALQLGRTCPIRVVGARYSLETPINRYLFDLLQELQWTSWLLERGDDADETVEQYLRREMRFRGEKGTERIVSDAEMTIYRNAFRLGRLVKEPRVIAAWRDDVVMPYIEVVECKGEKSLDRLRAVPVFAEILKTKKIHTWKAGRTAIYNAATAGLNALAHPVKSDSGSKMPG